jgi:hypothetical protein
LTGIERAATMKHTIFTASIVYILLIFVVFACIAGCSQEQSDQALIRQARMTGNENIELKKQIKACQREIETQKALLLQCHKDSEKAMQMTGDNSIKLLKIVDETYRQAEELMIENKQLKDQLKELHSDPAQKTQ